MKTEIRSEIVKHSTAGNLTKRYIYTWDETRFPTLDEALAFKNPNDPTEHGFLNKEFYGLPGDVKKKDSMENFDIDSLDDAQLNKLAAKLKSKIQAARP